MEEGVYIGLSRVPRGQGPGGFLCESCMLRINML